MGDTTKKFEELTKRLNSPIAEIAMAYRTSYCSAILQQTANYLIISAGLLLFVVSVFTASKTTMFVSGYMIFSWVILVCVSKIRFKPIPENKCSTEYFRIQNRITEIIGIQTELQRFNPNLSDDSFTVFQTKNRDYLVVYKVFSKLFPVAIITNSGCKSYIQRQLEIQNNNRVNFFLELKLDELKSYDFILKFVENDGKETVQLVNNLEELTGHYGIDYIRICFID